MIVFFITHSSHILLIKILNSSLLYTITRLDLFKLHTHECDNFVTEYGERKIYTKQPRRS